MDYDDDISVPHLRAEQLIQYR